MAGEVARAVVAFILTGLLGGWLAHRWQAQSAKEARFFEASRDLYLRMMSAADELSALIGRRLYASQRVCLLSKSSADYAGAIADYRAVVVEWNEKLLPLELAVRTRFRHSQMTSFEYLQSDLAAVSAKIEKANRTDDAVLKAEALAQIGKVRWEFFNFTENMIREANHIHRQMHFGIEVKYTRSQIAKMSTTDLFKSLFSSREEGDSIVRSPSDFGAPVSVGDARFGIYE